MPNEFARILIVTGHYGSGKTNLAVNIALWMSAQGKQVALADLDIVNPFFRSADFGDLLERHNIRLIAPLYARSNLDIPALTGELDGAITSQQHLVIDVGGDDAGATALGRYSPAILESGAYDLLYVVNRFRYLTRTPDEALKILAEIELKSRLKATGIVNNSNLGHLTTAQEIVDSADYAREVAKAKNLPLRFTTAEKELANDVKTLLPEEEIFPVDVYVKKPWE